MNMTLLDTHVLVWLLSGNSRLGGQARPLIQRAAEENTLLVSAITPWEIAMLVSKGRLALDRDVGEWVKAALALPGSGLSRSRQRLPLPAPAYPEPFMLTRLTGSLSPQSGRSEPYS